VGAGMLSSGSLEILGSWNELADCWPIVLNLLV